MRNVFSAELQLDHLKVESGIQKPASSGKPCLSWLPVFQRCFLTALPAPHLHPTWAPPTNQPYLQLFGPVCASLKLRALTRSVSGCCRVCASLQHVSSFHPSSTTHHCASLTEPASHGRSCCVNPNQTHLLLPPMTRRVKEASLIDSFIMCSASSPG